MKRLIAAGVGVTLAALAPTAAWSQAAVAAGRVPNASAPMSGADRTSPAELPVRAVCASSVSARIESRLRGCRALRVTQNYVATAPRASFVPFGLSPADLARAYSLPAATQGSRATVAVVDAGSYTQLEQDLAVYRAHFKLPPCTTKSGCLRIVGQTGGPPPAPATNTDDRDFDWGVSGETSLDVDAVSAACPTCKILVVLANRPDYKATNDDAFGASFATATNTAVRLGAAAVSISW
jgi:hypothetical protein